LALGRRSSASDDSPETPTVRRERRYQVELAITLGLGGWILLILGAVVFGVVAQFIGETKTGFEWLVDSIAAGLGAIIASEFIVGLQAYGPVWDGLALVPALVGGLVLGGIVELVTRNATGGTYSHRPMAA
jgi:uncharacterized membrane protein YeaQ/YmgE (transglycosylase-associated protein family)